MLGDNIGKVGWGYIVEGFRYWSGVVFLMWENLEEFLSKLVIWLEFFIFRKWIC